MSVLDWFRVTPRCPVITQDKAWTERRMLWLSQQFGRDRMLSAEFVTPEKHHLLDEHDGTAVGARRMLDRLCGFMAVDPATIDLEVGVGTSQSEKDVAPTRYAGPPSGIQERPGGVVLSPTGIQESPNPARHVVRVGEAFLGEATFLAAALNHGLARVLLKDRLAPLDDDYEFVADLLPVYFGTGAFAANLALIDYQHWLPPVKLQARTFGYAMALWAWARGEQSPAWAGTLRPDAAEALRQGLRYLRWTHDSLFRPDTVGETRMPSPGEVMARLNGKSASARLVALWEISEQALRGPEWVTALTARVEDRDPAVAAAACRLLGDFGADAAPAMPRLRAALAAEHRDVRAAAAGALGELRLEPDAVVPELCLLLDELDSAAFAAVSTALARYAVPIDGGSLARLLARLDGGLADGRDDVVVAVARALLATIPDPDRCVRDYFSHNAEWRKLALTALAEVREEDPVVAEMPWSAEGPGS